MAGHGRNQITRQLHEQGIKVSHGSVSNIINKLKHEQSSQLPPQPLPPNAGISTGVPMDIGAGSPLLSGTGQPKATKSNTNSIPRNREPDLNKSDVRVTTFPEEGLSEKEFKNNKGISIEDHAIVDEDADSEDSFEKGQGEKGGPLSWFTNGTETEIQSETSQSQTLILTDQPHDKTIDSSHINEEKKTSNSIIYANYKT